MGVVRSTFVIDENGMIEKVMPKVKPDTNAAEILAYLKGEKIYAKKCLTFPLCEGLSCVQEPVPKQIKEECHADYR